MSGCRCTFAPLIVLFSAVLCAQTAPPGSREVLLDVLNPKSGQQIADISVSSLEAKLQGRPVRVLDIKRTSTRRNVSIVLDASGSMSDLKTWQNAFYITAFSLEQLSSQANVTLVVMGNKYTKVIDNRHGINAMIDQLEALFKHSDKRVGSGHTQLYDAMLTAVSYGALGSGDSLFVVTDGGDNASHSSSDAVKRVLQEKSIRLFTVILAPFTVSTLEERQGPIDQEALAKAAGGRAIALHCCEADAKAALAGTFATILHPLLVTLETPPDASGKLSVKVVEADAKKSVVIAPMLLFPQAANPTPAGK